MTSSPFFTPTDPASRLLFITQDDSQHSLKEQIYEFIIGGGRLTQLRLKNMPLEVVAKKAKRFVEFTHDGGAQMLINDYTSVAKASEADGVHLGKEDGAPSEARKLLGDDKIIGATAHNWDELYALRDEPIDYIGLGPLRFTRSKTNLATPLGMDGVKKLLTRAQEAGINTPIFIIGGIEQVDVRELLLMGAYGVAISGAIALASDPCFATKKFLESIAKTMR